MSTIYGASDPGGPNDFSDSPKSGAPESSDAQLLKRIRRRFDYMVEAWRDIREKGARDMRALSDEGPWEPEERAERIKNKRPCIHLDQLEQYTNQLINEVRQNPYGVNVIPKGVGASDKTAELRENRIRQIDYETDGQPAMLCAFEAAVQRSYGAFAVQIDYERWDSFDQQIQFRRFPNPDAVLWDPGCKKLDCSDMQDCFVLDAVPMDDFPREYPDATVTSFGTEEIAIAPNWVDKSTDTVQVAEYWYIEKKRRQMFLCQPPDGRPQQRIFGDELEGFKKDKNELVLKSGERWQIIDERETYQPTVMCCTTNGVEILDKTEWPGRWIPVFPLTGKEKFVREGNKAKRVLESYIRKAIDAQQLFDYYKTNEAEVVGMAPKAPFVGYVGQFETDPNWATIHKQPRAYLEVDPVTDGTGQQVLPIPERNQFEPPIQALEVGAEAARRSIQSAVGSYQFTKLDDTNVKSGKAINLLDKQSDLGSFHFIDNYKVVLKHAFRVINDLLDKVETGQRTVGTRTAAGDHKLVTLNKKYVDEDKQPQHYQYSENDNDAEHDITISTGPSYQSQRDEASNYADTLSQNPNIFPLIGDLVVKLKDLGPIGDEIAERLHKMLPAPLQDQQQNQQIPPQVQQQLQQSQQMIQKLTQELHMLLDEKQSKSMELQAKASMQAYSDDVRLAIAQVQAKQKMSADDLTAFMGKMDSTLQLLMQARDHAHDASMGAADAAVNANPQVTHTFDPQTQQLQPANG